MDLENDIAQMAGAGLEIAAFGMVMGALTQNMPAKKKKKPEAKGKKKKGQYDLI